MIPGNFNQNASWLSKVKERLSEIENQEHIRVSVENLKAAIRKMTNWKAPGPDFFQGYWFKMFSTFHSRLTEHLQTCVVVIDVQTWMAKGKNIDLEGSRKNKCCQQLLPYRMSTTNVEAAT